MLYMDEGVPTVMRRLGVWGLLLQLGWAMVVPLAGGFIVGWAVDGALGTAPWATLGFALLGIAAGTYSVYRLIASVLDEQRNR